MVARFLYRLASLFFRLASLACWAIGIGGIILQFTSAGGFSVMLFSISIWAFVLAMLTWQASGEAWRAARIHHVRC